MAGVRDGPSDSRSRRAFGCSSWVGASLTSASGLRSGCAGRRETATGPTPLLRADSRGADSGSRIEMGSIRGGATRRAKRPGHNASSERPRIDAPPDRVLTRLPRLARLRPKPKKLLGNRSGLRKNKSAPQTLPGFDPSSLSDAFLSKRAWMDGGRRQPKPPGVLRQDVLRPCRVDSCPSRWGGCELRTGLVERRHHATLRAVCDPNGGRGSPTQPPVEPALAGHAIWPTRFDHAPAEGGFRRDAMRQVPGVI